MKTRTLITTSLVALSSFIAELAAAQAPAAQPAPPAATPAPAASAPANAASAPAQAPVPTGQVLPDRAEPALEGISPEPGGLTANEVARRALIVAPSVKQKRAEVSAANEKVTQTEIQFFPKLTLLAGYQRISNVTTSLGSLVPAETPGPLSVQGTQVLDAGGHALAAVPFVLPTVPNNYLLEATASIPLSDYILKLSDAAASSNAGVESSRLNVAAEKLKVETDAKTLYFNWLRARAQTSIARSSVEQTHARLQDAQASFNVGAISKADLLRIQALVANTELILNQAESMQALTTGQLAIVMEDWHPNYHVGEGIPEPTSIADADAPLNNLIAEGHSRRLEMHAMDEAVKSLTRGASATRSGSLPRIDATGNVIYANPNQRYFPPQSAWHATWAVGVQASWTIDDTFANSSAARALDDQAQAMMAQQTALRAGIADEVLIAYLNLGRARVALDKQRTALAAAQEGYRVTTDLFRAGRATSTDLLEDEQRLLEAKLGDVNARIDLTLAAIALKHATGRDVRSDTLEAKN
jgi:outer membrane protein TolC